MGKKKEMVGKRFGRNLVLSEVEERGKGGLIHYVCQCDCGKIHISNGQALRKGQSLSCGCYNREIITKDNPNYRKPLYYVYYAIKDRCKNPNNKSYHNYGGRGIKLSEEWDTFDSFEKWCLTNGYEHGLWLDRINNDGDYSPDNCRFVSPKVQQNNKRTNRLLTINGVTKNITTWAEENGIKPCTLQRRIKLGWDEDKLLAPVMSKYSHGDLIKDSKKGDHK